MYPDVSFICLSLYYMLSAVLSARTGHYAAAGRLVMLCLISGC